ncbi:hypothetical protein K9U40_14680 [Xanthobacter autotrophicus]|uniref:hypothetical protein n=1 Tax=Xanthobacter autotrophicus TaxID=280 RepID=UPI0024AB6FC5|nr:hypothetical protein [Xanthobacter autotrophicus]MDI4665559.1 hypothetical protein [Xanthobacter autotrophicus]
MNDIHSDVWHLYQLLDILVETLIDGRTASESMERAAALAWIARDLAEQTGAAIDNNFRGIAKGIPSQTEATNV